RRLFVRGTGEQIKQIEDLIARLDARGQTKNNSDLRFVPLPGPTRETVLQTAKQNWQGDNCLQILPPAEANPTSVIERTVFPDAEPAAKAEPIVSPTKDQPEPADQPPTLKNRDDFVAT